MTARINALVTARCGNTANCFAVSAEAASAASSKYDRLLYQMIVLQATKLFHHCPRPELAANVPPQTSPTPYSQDPPLAHTTC
jgi:hypothetical protein